MKKSKVISLVLLPLLICALILSPSVAAQGSDPQEAIIKQVIAETGAEFGWDIGDCIHISHASFCTYINVRNVSYEGTSRSAYSSLYSLDVYLGDSDEIWMIFPVEIEAYPTEAEAEVALSETIEWYSSYGYGVNTKAITFHNLSAFSIGGLIVAGISSGYWITWQAGRFHFSTGSSLERGGCPPKEIAEALYANAVKYGLIGGEVVEGVAFTINVQAPGYLPWSDTLATKDYEPSSITLEGVVKDEEGNPVSGATISIPDLGKSVTSGVQGNYKLYVQTEGTKPFTKVHNIILQKEVTGASIKVETEKVIPVPGEVTITITALDQDGKPFKGSVDITVVDKNNKQIYFTELKETAGYELDDNGKYSTKLEIWNPGERELKLSGGYTYLRDIPLTATIRVEIQDKELNTIGKEEKTVPFNLALIHGVVVDNKDLKPVTQHYEPDVLGISNDQVFDKEKNPNGDFWVMVKPIRRDGKSIQDIMNKGTDFALKWPVEDEIPLVYSIEEAPVPGEVLELGKVGKTPLEKIKEWYTEFGTSPRTWPDGTTDKKALTGPYSTGALNNFMDSFWLCSECSRFHCIAMQYKTLRFLNNLKNKKVENCNKPKFLCKLKGLDYAPVFGICPPWPRHNAVALWDRGKWESSQATTLPPIGTGAIILDPHGNQKPHWYSADTVPFSWTIRQGKEKEYEDSGWKPPWSEVKVKQPKGKAFTVNCPVDVLIVNSQGQRLGILPNGDKVAEFEPIDSYFWQDEKGDKQWFFALPQDTYEIELLGTGSGNFHLLTSSSGEEIHDYGDNPIAAGDQATLIMNPEEDELTLADGKEVTPTIIKLPPAPIPPSKFNKCVGDEPYLYVEDRIMEKGKTLEIPIIMCNAKDLANMDLDWSYNASVLKLINVTKGSLNEKAVFDWNEVSPGKLKIAFASAKGVTGSGTIAVMKFEVIGNTGDTSTLTGTVTTASKTDGTEISVSVTPGEFTVGTPAGHKLVAYYPFNGDTQDHSGNGNHGTNHGATFVSGVSGKALEFDGVNDVVEVVDNDSIDLKDAGSIEAWIKYTGPLQARWFISKASEKGYNAYLNNYAMGIINGIGFGASIGAGSGIGDSVAAFHVITNNVWIHVAFTWDGTTLRLYKNGSEITNSTQRITPTINDQSLFIGKESSSDGYFFQGVIDEVRIYNYALTASEIKANYDMLSLGGTAPPGGGIYAGFKLPPTEKWGRETWFNTQINVTSGQTISITASGMMVPSKTSNVSCGPNGTLEFEYWQKAFIPNPDWGHAALIARIGAAGDPIFIGTDTTFVAPTDGELWLGINDYDGSNNIGEFVAEICIGEKTPTPTPSGSGTSYQEATLTHSGFDFSDGTTGESPIRDGEAIFWQPGHAGTHPDYPDYSEYLWWRNTHLDNVNYTSQTKDMGAVDIATVRAVPAEWDKSPLIPPLLMGHTIVAKCYDGYVKFQVISVDPADESARVKYWYSPDTTFDEGTPTLQPTP